MGSTGHLSVRQGQRVIAHMRDGTKFIGKFKERKARYVLLELDKDSDMALPTHSIRTLSIYKGKEKS